MDLQRSQKDSLTVQLLATDGASLGSVTLASADPVLTPALSLTDKVVRMAEGGVYEYRIDAPQPLSLQAEDIIVPSRLEDGLRGTIEVGASVGLVAVNVVDPSQSVVAELWLDVQPRKLDSDEFRKMLDDIADETLDLVVRLETKASVPLRSNLRLGSQSVQLKYALLHHVLTADTFRAAVERIASRPSQRLLTEDTRRPINAPVRLGGNALRELATSKERVDLQNSHPLYDTMIAAGVERPSLPSHVLVATGVFTADTPENRFVKHVLSEFDAFLRAMLAQMEPSSRGSALATEIAHVLDEVEGLLAIPFYKSLARPRMFPISSPVLQRRSEYREVLSVWLRFLAATQLDWEGGEDIFHRGHRSIDVLYEYWVYFRLLSIVRSRIELDDEELLRSLFTQTQGRFDLRLKTGNELSLEGQVQKRGLRARFSYKRHFPGSKPFNEPGSWAMKMIPDYTISLWPIDMTESEAEARSCVAHLCFDAKYRVKYGTQDETPRNPIREVPRDPLHTMLAYLIGVRGSIGAYAIFPGDNGETWRQFGERMPGVGSVPLRPGPELERNELLIASLIDDAIDVYANNDSVWTKVNNLLRSM